MTEKLPPDVEELIRYNRAACKHEKMEQVTRRRGVVDGQIGSGYDVSAWYCNGCKCDVVDKLAIAQWINELVENAKELNTLSTKVGAQLTFPVLEKRKSVSNEAIDTSTWRVPLT